jgi:hypothetical protein
LRWGNICIIRAKECSGLALLWVKIFKVYFSSKSGSGLAMEWVMVPGIGGHFGAFRIF